MKLSAYLMVCTIHYGDDIMGTMASQIPSLTIVYSVVYSCADQRKHQSSASLASVRGIHRRPANSPHKWPVTRKLFPFDDVIMYIQMMNFPKSSEADSLTECVMIYKSRVWLTHFRSHQISAVSCIDSPELLRIFVCSKQLILRS